jgi:hypothetical protein
LYEGEGIGNPTQVKMNGMSKWKWTTIEWLMIDGIDDIIIMDYVREGRGWAMLINVMLRR